MALVERREPLQSPTPAACRKRSTYLGIPCLTLRENTERPITVTQGSNRLVQPQRLARKRRARARRASGRRAPSGRLGRARRRDALRSQARRARRRSAVVAEQRVVISFLTVPDRFPTLRASRVGL